MRLVSVLLPAAELEAIAAHVAGDARLAAADRRYADAITYLRRAARLYVIAGADGEGEYCTALADHLAAQEVA